MISVMIVDDEFIARVGMRSMVDWNQYGYEVVAEASSGREGVEQFRKHRPRLIFCDINMPDRNGLEMMREIRALDSTVACVILTAHQDFDYAQQAIKLGVVEYVTKATMLTEDIVALLKSLYSRLAPTEEDESVGAQRRQEKEQLFSALVSGQENAQAATVLLDRFFPGQDKFYFLYARPADSVQQPVEPQVYHTIETILCDVMREHDIPCAVLHHLGAFLAVMPDVPAQKLYKAIQRVLNGVLHYVTRGLKIGLAEELTREQLIAEGYRRAHHAFQRHALYEANTGYIVYEDVRCDKLKAKETVNACLAQISHCLLAMEYTQAKREVAALFKEVVTPTGSLEILHLATVGALGRLAEYVPFNEDEELARLKAMDNRSDAVLHLFSLIDEAEQTAAGGASPMRLHVENARGYIDANYTHPISLKDVAAALALSQNYLSKIFFKETGKYITDYIHDAKLAFACEQLKATSDSVAAIAERCGFVDQAYFTRLFKKKLGVSPNSYRKKAQ